MRTGIGPFFLRLGRAIAPRLSACAILVFLSSHIVIAAEFGAGPWIKGGTDIFAGVVPSQPGFYSRTDVYHYEADVSAVVFNGRVEVGVEQDMTATLPSVTYVTPWKPFGGTYAVGVVPSIMAVDVNVGIGLPPITGPLGNTFGPITLERGDTNLALGDTGLIPIMLGWDAGNFHWSGAMFVLAPTGDYSTRQLANTSLNRWALMPRLAATYFDPKSGWQVNGVAVYAVSYENDATNYDSGDILNLEGSILKNFGRLGVGAVGYGMIQTTPDSGAGATLGANEAQIYGAGPIITYSLGDPKDPLTFVASISESSAPSGPSRAMSSTSPSASSSESALGHKRKS